VARPWYIDGLVFVFAVLWMGWSFTVMQSIGPNLPILLAAVAVGVLGILMLYGHRINYLRIGDRFLLEMDHGRDDTEPEQPPERRQ
jgi:hypothetical protein